MLTMTMHRLAMQKPKPARNIMPQGIEHQIWNAEYGIGENSA
jgi:hypothetical protein